jgi:5,10-methylenetetrahydrofolate reductase
VTEAADLARRVGERIGTPPCLGAITIPTRRGGSVDEPARMVRKIQHGVRFFTSQVLFEADSSRALLRDYDAACKAAGVRPAPVFLSFAPITGRKDADFLEWLGVEIPATSKEWILAPHANALDRSARVAEHLLRDVLMFVDRHHIDVPIGINVEHVMRYNFEASEAVLDRLESLLEWTELERHARSEGPR